ncbi:unnamed protein product [Schistosoma guineensis]
MPIMLHQMIEHSFIITAYISVCLLDCFNTQSNVAHNFTLLSLCEECPECNTNMHCNYSQWICILGLPKLSLAEDYWLETVETKSDCLNECRYYPQCNLYTYEINEPRWCDLYSGFIANITINVNSTNFITGGRVCCHKSKSCLE